MGRKIPAKHDPYLRDAGVDGISISVGAQTPGQTTRNVAIQLQNGYTADLAVRGSVLMYISDDPEGDDVTASAPTSVAIGTDGVAIPLVAGKLYQLVSEADGDIDVTLTKDGTATWYVNVVMADGTISTSAAIGFTTTTTTTTTTTSTTTTT